MQLTNRTNSHVAFKVFCIQFDYHNTTKDSDSNRKIEWEADNREISRHATATMGLAMSLRGGSINLSNSWNRQLSITSNASMVLNLDSNSSVTVGWRKRDQKWLQPERLG